MYKVSELFDAWEALFVENKDYLTELDSVAGDADLGIVMNDGFISTAQFVRESDLTDVGMLFFKAGKHFNNVASSSMGTLLSNGFMTIGKALKGKDVFEEADLPVVVSKMAEGVQAIGKAKEGEKTFLDAILPAARAFEGYKDIKEAVNKAVKEAEDGVERAKNLVGKHGRIAFRGEGSIGIIDPGSVVALILVKGIAKVVNEK